MEFEGTRHVPVSAEKAWNAVSDLAGYAGVAPTISRVEMTGEAGLAAKRRCYDASGNGWDEVCTLWQPGEAFRMSVDTSTYPRRLRMLFKSFEGEWRVSPSAEGGSDITLRFVAQPRNALANVILRASRRSVRRAIERVLDGYEHQLPRDGQEGSTPSIREQAL